MKRYLYPHIIRDIPEKVILIMGPRQCGKTTLSKQLDTSFDYFNYDAIEDRLRLTEKSWDRTKNLIIFDEIHKMKEWKRWVKGIFDTEGIPPGIVVTGSARMDVHRRVGDSLAGRYFQFRLHPFDLKELVQFGVGEPDAVFENYWRCSGFPEPFIKGSETFYRRWRKTHLDIILRQDLLDLQSVKAIQSIETLVALLKERIGSSISYANLARDLEVDAKTVKRWLQLLENLYVLFKVTPYSKNIARSLLKEPKYYFYDHTYAEDEGARLENIVACSLLKELHFLEDVMGYETSLHYLRTKQGNEVDFLVTINNKPHALIEVKTSDAKPAKGFEYFSNFLPDVKKIQLVKSLKHEKTYPNGLEVRGLVQWLSKFKLVE